MVSPSMRFLDKPHCKDHASTRRRREKEKPQDHCPGAYVAWFRFPYRFARFSSTRVRIRSASKATSNGFLNDSLKPKLVKPSGLASSSLAKPMMRVAS